MNIYRDRRGPAPTKVVKLWFKLVVGAAVSSMVFLPAVFVTIFDTSGEILAVPELLTGRLVVYVIAWGVSILLTAASEDEHLWDCFMNAFGVPGFVLGIGLASQWPE